MIQAIVFLPLIGAILAGLIAIYGAHARNPSGDTVEHHDDAHGADAHGADAHALAHDDHATDAHAMTIMAMMIMVTTITTWSSPRRRGRARPN